MTQKTKEQTSKIVQGNTITQITPVSSSDDLNRAERDAILALNPSQIASVLTRNTTLDSNAIVNCVNIVQARLG